MKRPVEYIVSAAVAVLLMLDVSSCMLLRTGESYSSWTDWDGSSGTKYTNYSEGYSETRYDDGTYIYEKIYEGIRYVTNPDGSKETYIETDDYLEHTLPDGTKEKTANDKSWTSRTGLDGIESVTYKNGDTKKIWPDGKTALHDAERMLTIVTHPDGTTEIVLDEADGKTFDFPKHDKVTTVDSVTGDKFTKYNDGATETFTASTGSTVWEKGAVRKTTYKSGAVMTEDGNAHTEEMAYPDGTTYTKLLDEGTELKKKDGKTTVKSLRNNPETDTADLRQGTWAETTSGTVTPIGFAYMDFLGTYPRGKDAPSSSGIMRPSPGNVYAVLWVEIKNTSGYEEDYTLVEDVIYEKGGEAFAGVLGQIRQSNEIDDGIAFPTGARGWQNLTWMLSDSDRYPIPAGEYGYYMYYAEIPEEKALSRSESSVYFSVNGESVIFRTDK